MKDSVDVRYAMALFSLAKDERKIKEYQTSLKEIRVILDEHSDLLNLLKSEFVTTSKRYQTVDKVFKNYPTPILNFLKVLIQNHRLTMYRSIFYTFNSLCNEENHVLEGIIYSTKTLEANELHEIEDALKTKNKMEVELTNRIDPNLIGGIKVVINNHIYDYSIQNELINMRNALK